jgi:hypothetical protein
MFCLLLSRQVCRAGAAGRCHGCGTHPFLTARGCSSFKNFADIKNIENPNIFQGFNLLLKISRNLSALGAAHLAATDESDAGSA